MKRMPLSVAIVLSLALLRCGSRAASDVKPLEPEVAKQYSVRIPEDYDPNEAYPLVIGLHGRGRSENEITGLWDDGFFYMPDFILVGVRAPFRTSGGYCWIRYDAGTEPTKETYLASALTCERLVREVLDEVEQRYKVDPDFRTIMGISEGASAAYFTVLRHPGIFSGIADLIGRIPECLLPGITRQDAGNLKVFIGMGEREPGLALDAAKERAERLRRAGAKVRFNLHDDEHMVKAEQVRAIENFFELGLTKAPINDYVYDRDGMPKMSPGPGPDEDNGRYSDEDDY